jgi:hypothetical protein
MAQSPPSPGKERQGYFQVLMTVWSPLENVLEEQFLTLWAYLLVFFIIIGSIF